MITELTKEYIPDIAVAQVRAWQKAFKGILSDEVLSSLDVTEFANNWRKIITQKERKNWIWVGEDDKGVGFVSFGKPKDEKESADFEIYGIYVHPKFWGQKIGYKLMNHAVESIQNTQKSSRSRLILWTMTNNTISRKFYKQYGFLENGKSRISSRNNEHFEELQFELNLQLDLFYPKKKTI